jgi:integrase
MQLAKLKLKFVNEVRDGAVIWRYFRRKGSPRVPLPGFIGSPEFMEAYTAALAGTTPTSPTTLRNDAGTFGKLIEDYRRTASFSNLSASSKLSYGYALNPLVKAHGHRPLNSMPRDKLIKIIEGIGAKSPGMANLTRAVLHKILKDAHKRGTIRENPLAAGVDRFKGGSFHSWTDDELSVFEARWPVGTRERLAYALYFYTGQRGSDVARMNRADITATGIKVVQKKTGAELNIELHPDLISIIRLTPSKGLSLIGNKHNGRPIQRAALTALIREAVGKAGLPARCKPHGLRKAAMRVMAEGGATGKQLAAVSGHRTTKEVDRYTAAADQTRLARGGIATMPTRTRTEVPSH